MHEALARTAKRLAPAASQQRKRGTSKPGAEKTLENS